jgi:hypothetical protein
MLVGRIRVDSLSNGRSLSRRTQLLLGPGGGKGGFLGLSTVLAVLGLVQVGGVVLDTGPTGILLHGVNVRLGQIGTRKVGFVIRIVLADSPFLGIPTIGAWLEVAAAKESDVTTAAARAAIGTPSLPVGLPLSARLFVVLGSHASEEDHLLEILLATLLIVFQVQQVVGRQLHPPSRHTADPGRQVLLLERTLRHA